MIKRYPMPARMPAISRSATPTIKNASHAARPAATKPKAAGIAVPGMVMGSPGMEHGDHREAYQVLLFDKAGKTKVFASH